MSNGAASRVPSVRRLIDAPLSNRVIGNLDKFKEGVTEIDGKVQAIDKQINDTSYLEEGVPPS